MNRLSIKIFISAFLLLSILISCKKNEQTADNQQDATSEEVVEEREVITAFADEIEAFTIADQQDKPQEGAALFVGSSSIRMWKTLAEDLAPYPVINRGFGGSTFKELNYYADRIVYPYKPKCVFVYEGDNDITNEEITPNDVLENFRTFHRNLQEKYPGIMTYFISIKPSIARENLWQKASETNTMIQRLAKIEPTIEYVNVATQMLSDDGSLRSDIFIEDNLHMNETGYALWTPIVKIFLKKEFSRDN